MRQNGSTEDERLIDTDAVRDWIRLVPRAVRRRKWVALSVFTLMMAVTVVSVRSMPKAYRTHVRILASPLEGAPGTVRGQGGGEKSELAEATVDVVRSHDALLEIIRGQHLVALWESQRTPLFRFKDTLVRKLSGRQPTEEDLEEALIVVLEKRVELSAADHVVDIAVTWPDAKAARSIVEAM